MPSDQAPALLSFTLWALAAASFTGWGLAMWPVDQRPVAAVAEAYESSTGLEALQPDISKLLGRQDQAVVSAPALASRLSLLGVAKAGDSDAVALISVDGQPVKPVLRGAEVLPGLRLQSVTLEQAMLGASLRGPASLVLTMPKRAEPVSGQPAPLTTPSDPGRAKPSLNGADKT